MRSRLGAWCVLFLLLALPALTLAQSPQLWSTHYSFGSYMQPEHELMARGPEGSYYTVANSRTYRMEIGRWTADGQQLWVRQFEGHAIDIKANASGVAISGWGGPGSLLLRIDLSGNTFKPTYNANASFHDLALAPNGDALVATSVEPGSQEVTIGFLRYSPAGQLLSNTEYAKGPDCLSQGIWADANGITLIGRVNGKRFVARYDLKGVPVWNKVVDIPPSDPLDYRVDATGAVYVLSWYEGGSYGAKLTKFDNSGTLVYNTDVRDLAALAVGPSGQAAVVRNQSEIQLIGPDGQIQVYIPWNGVGSQASAAAFDEEGNLYYTGSIGDLYTPAAGFVVKTNPKGERLWTRLDLGISAPATLSYANGSAVIFGHQGSVIGTSLTMAKVDSFGKIVWRAQNGPTRSKLLTLDSVVDPAGIVYLAGEDDSRPYETGFVTQIGSNGAPQWARQCPFPVFEIESHPAGGVVAVRSNSHTSFSVVVTRYSATGVPLWEHQALFGRKWTFTYYFEHEIPQRRSIAVDGAGNTYLVGIAAGDPARVAVRKLNPAGAVVWTGYWTIPAGTEALPRDIVVAANGLIYVALERERSIASVLQFAATGTVNWSRDYISPSSAAIALATDKDSNVCLLGETGPSGFVLKLATNGSTLWSTLLTEGKGSAVMADLTMDAAGNLYAAGARRQTGPTGAYAATLTKLNAAGAVQWFRFWDDPSGTRETSSGVALDGAGAVILAGTTWNPERTSDYFVLKYGVEDGAVLWPDSGGVLRAGAAIFDGGWGLHDAVVGLGLDSARNIYVGGSSVGPSGVLNAHAVKYSSDAGTRPLIDSVFVRQSVSTTMTADQLYTASVIFRNSGSTPWTKGTGFRLVSMNPYLNSTWGQSTVLMDDGETIYPGESKVFRLSFYAPSAGGTYNFRWRLFKDGIGTFGAASPNVTMQVVKRAHAARFISQSVPTTVQVGVPFTVQVTMKNVGTNTWTQGGGYTLRPAPDYPGWGITAVHLSSEESIPPGGQKTFTFSCTPPAVLGNHVLRWQMHRASNSWAGFFGEQTPPITVTVVP